MRQAAPRCIPRELWPGRWRGILLADSAGRKCLPKRGGASRSTVRVGGCWGTEAS